MLLANSPKPLPSNHTEAMPWSPRALMSALNDAFVASDPLPRSARTVLVDPLGVMSAKPFLVVTSTSS